jgi:hypothetical protein
MAEEIRSWARQGEAFWRAHHEAWKRSDLINGSIARLRASRSKASATGDRSSRLNRSLLSASCYIAAEA